MLVIQFLFQELLHSAKPDIVSHYEPLHELDPRFCCCKHQHSKRQVGKSRFEATRMFESRVVVKLFSEYAAPLSIAVDFNERSLIPELDPRVRNVSEVDEFLPYTVLPRNNTLNIRLHDKF